jgi:hypothetical protein
MNRKNDPLNRLLSAAAKARRSQPDEAPLGAETRCLANWRSLPAADETAWLLLWLRRAILLAGFAVLLSLCWDYRQTDKAPDNELSVVDSSLVLAMGR